MFSGSIEVEHIMYPAGNYMLKFNNRNTRTMCEICSKFIHVIAGYVRYNIKFEF